MFLSLQNVLTFYLYPPLALTIVRFESIKIGNFVEDEYSEIYQQPLYFGINCYLSDLFVFVIVCCFLSLLSPVSAGRREICEHVYCYTCLALYGHPSDG